eukprot:scaffold105592_cov30-Phaeocystis_antarctica.AAC.1
MPLTGAVEGGKQPRVGGGGVVGGGGGRHGSGWLGHSGGVGGSWRCPRPDLLGRIHRRLLGVE